MADAPVSQSRIYAFMIMMLISGSINTIANKFQQNLTALGSLYSHPWFVTTCMFLGESTCLIWYALHCYNENKKKQYNPLIETDAKEKAEVSHQSEKPELSPFLIIIPAMCDFFGSTLMCLGLSMMASSVYQMFRGSVIIFTATASVVFLKNKLYRHNFLGMGFVVLGLLLVGAGAIFELGNSGAQTKALGVILVIIAQIFSAGMFISEEKLMKMYKCHPLKLVGFEGMWGLILYSILMVVFKFITCPFGEDLRGSICVHNDKGEWLLEDAVFAFRQLGENNVLLMFAILYTLSISLFNFVGISITKYVSAAARAVVDSVRTVVVWVFFLSMPFVPESTKEHFSYLQLCGFVVLVSGTIIFNEVVVLPFWGLNLYTKQARQLRETQEAANEESLGTIQNKSKTDVEKRITEDEDTDEEKEIIQTGPIKPNPRASFGN